MNRPGSLISSCSSSFSKPQIEYDVFLSFRGEDTRCGFTSFLHRALCEKGIDTFLDDDRLERGKSIAPELLKAIESSRCSVIVISENYASSSWCLDELVKIIQSKEAYKQIVLPIFYHVDPSHVRKQSGSIGEAFKKHEQVFGHDLEKVQSWRDALKEVGNLAGWHLQRYHDEPKFIQDFAVKVSNKVGIARLNFLEDLFGMESRLEELDGCVCTTSLEGVSFVGICGIGGIGKTTLARAYYEWMTSTDQFIYHSFLANVRENCAKKEGGIVYLQNLLLSNILKGSPEQVYDVHEGKNMIQGTLCRKKVLIVLDDVDKLDQLEALVGKDNWFGPGSRIIITTRDKSLLAVTYKKPQMYEPEQLNCSESIQLFSCYAFKDAELLEDYKELSNQVVNYAKGLPLALKVLGSFLCNKTKEEWKDALKRLEKYPKKEIFQVLHLSFDGLEDVEKNIFLDIACFFNGFDKDEIVHIMDICGFHPLIGIRNLIEKSLLNDGPHNKLWMHDLLQEMGRGIVREKSHNEPGQWSRLWDCSDLRHVLENNMGSEKVEAIVLDDSLYAEDWGTISNMKKLRLLICSSYPRSEDGLQYLSNELRILRWKYFQFESLPSSFQPIQLFELTLEESNLRQLWIKPMKPLYTLKIINLRFSKKLRKFEDFGVVPNLEKLILQCCDKLVEVNLSTNILTRLTLLKLDCCYKLKHLPQSLSGLISLKVLDLSFCKRLGNLPKDMGHLNSLEELDLSRTFLKNLHRLSCRTKSFPLFFLTGYNSESRHCGNTIRTISGEGPITGCFPSLKKLDLSDCRLVDGKFPEDLGCLAYLQELNLENNSFSCLPPCMNQLFNLRILDLSDCRKLKSLGPELPPNLELVKLVYCTSLNTFQDPLDDRCGHLRFSAICFDCVELVRRQGSKRTAFASLKRYLQNLPNPSRRFDIMLPGNEIPNWFTCQSSGRLMSFKLDPNWCNTKWMGFAFCVSSKEIWLPPKCNVRINEKELASIEHPLVFSKGVQNHIWLFYLPRDHIHFDTEWLKSNCSPFEFSIELNSYMPIASDIGNEYGYGVRLVYEEDIQDLNMHSENEDYIN